MMIARMIESPVSIPTIRIDDGTRFNFFLDKSSQRVLLKHLQPIAAEAAHNDCALFRF